MDPEFLNHLECLTPLVYYVTEEEDVFFKELTKVIPSSDEHNNPNVTLVFTSATGVVTLKDHMSGWDNPNQNVKPASIHDALMDLHKGTERGVTRYIITDPHKWLSDDQVQRRVLNLAHQINNNPVLAKSVIFVGSHLYVPPRLQRYIEVVRDRGLSDAKYTEHLKEVTSSLRNPKTPPNLLKAVRGLTTYETKSALKQSVVATKRDAKNPRRVDLKFITNYKRKQLNKTDLVKYLDVSETTFESVGGVDRFKAWAEKTKACWTDKGQAFGLKPPKGVLCVGVWGCGKSLSVKALGNAWNLPVVSLEMGKLRSSAVGATEANMYRALALIESVAPVLVCMDEAEKSMAGSHSSSHSDAGTASRVLGIFSTWLQETKAPICFAMTANSLKTLPVEFVNRMTERFFFDLPSQEERIEIIKIHLRKQGQEPDAVDNDEPRYNLYALSTAAKNMVGREIEQAIEASMVESFDQGCKFLDNGVLLHELQVKPRIYKTMKDELTEVLDWVGYDDEIEDGIRAKLASKNRSEVFNQFKVSTE